MTQNEKIEFLFSLTDEQIFKIMYTIERNSIENWNLINSFLKIDRELHFGLYSGFKFFREIVQNEKVFNEVQKLVKTMDQKSELN